MNRTEIGERIKERRLELHLTREQFSELINVTPKFLSDIETGEKGFSIETLERLVKNLGLSADYILFGEKENNSTINVVNDNNNPDNTMEHDKADDVIGIYE